MLILHSWNENSSKGIEFNKWQSISSTNNVGGNAIGDAANEITLKIQSFLSSTNLTEKRKGKEIENFPKSFEEVNKVGKKLYNDLKQSPLAIILLTLGISTSGFYTYKRYFKRIPTASYFTPSTLKSRKIIVGRCTSVGDADGFRLYHTPGPPIYRHLMYNKITNGSGNHHHYGQNETISIRIAGADAPESSHFGKPAQPFSKEAKILLENLVLGKEIYCEIGHVDQYQRLVATPYVWLKPYIFGKTNVSLTMVKKGLATVYTQTGASYGNAGILTKLFRWIFSNNKNNNSTTKSSSSKRSLLDKLFPLSGESRLLAAQAKAKRKKIGIWSQKNFESPEDYKKRIKAGG